MHVTFTNPVYLWYFISLPLLVITHFLSLRSAKRKAMKFANFQTLKRIAGKRFVTKNVMVLVIRLLILSMLILAASGLKLWYETERTDNNYVVAIDVSSSMAAQDIQPTRLDAAKLYASQFVEGLPPDSEVGVVTFSGVTLIQQTMTKDRLLLKAVIDEVDVVQAGGTDIPGAVITSTNLLLANPDKGRVIILFTDGSSTLGNFEDNSLEHALEYASEYHVVVHAFGVGSESGPIGYLPQYYNISATYNEETLRLLTNSTGGVLLQSNNGDDILDSYDVLLGSKEQGFIEVDVDYGLLIIGILILFIEWGLINSRYRRIT